jgi:signal peptidase I
MPGLGHMYSGKAKRGFILFILSLLVSSVAPMLGLVDSQPFNVIFMVLVFISIYIYAIMDSVRITRSLKYGYVLKKYNKWFFYVVVLFVYLIVIQPFFSNLTKHFIVKAYKMPSGSMEPTLLVGDHILVNKFIYRNAKPQKGDIIVFEYPPDPSKDFVKRVAGIPGDVLEIRNNEVIIHRNENERKSEKPHANSNHSKRFFGPITVPEDVLFVLGDNMDHSYDSRFWGYVPIEKVKGKVVSVYWSWNSDPLTVRWKRIGMKLH